MNPTITDMLLLILIQFAITFGITFVSMKFIAPKLTGNRFALIGNFWKSALIITLLVIGAPVLANQFGSALVGMIPQVGAYFQQFPLLISVWMLLFQAVAIYLLGKMFHAWVRVDNFPVAVGVALINTVFMVLIQFGLVAIMALLA